MPALGSQYESVRKPWQLIGRFHYDPLYDVCYAPIGPRLLFSAGHLHSLPESAFIGRPIDIQGLTVHVQSMTQSPAGVDIAYVTVDQDIPQWFKRVTPADKSKFSNSNNILVIAGGLGSGGYSVDGEGWPQVASGDYSTMGMRWGIQKADYIGEHNLYPPNPVQPDPPPYRGWACFFRHHDDPLGHPETTSARDQDSGGTAFVDIGPVDDPWVCMGCTGGGGAGYLSPYKGQITTGHGGGMLYLDYSYIAHINGETEEPVPPPVQPPPAGKPPTVIKKPVVPVTPPPPPRIATAFDQAIERGMIIAEGLWGDTFTIDGRPSYYVGTFNAYDKAQQIGDGGYEENIDATLVASIAQFGTYTPKNGIRISVAGQRYVAARVIQDSASWAFQLTGQHK